MEDIIDPKKAFELSAFGVEIWVAGGAVLYLLFLVVRWYILRRRRLHREAEEAAKAIPPHLQLLLNEVEWCETLIQESEYERVIDKLSDLLRQWMEYQYTHDFLGKSAQEVCQALKVLELQEQEHYEPIVAFFELSDRLKFSNDPLGEAMTRRLHTHVLHIVRPA